MSAGWSPCNPPALWGPVEPFLGLDWIYRPPKGGNTPLTAVWVHTGPGHTLLHCTPILAGQGPVLPWLSHVFSSSTIYELGLVATVDDVVNFASILSLHGLKGKHRAATMPGQMPRAQVFLICILSCICSTTLCSIFPRIQEACSFKQLCDDFFLSTPMADD